jgi:hypothetical protein
VRWTGAIGDSKLRTRSPVSHASGESAPWVTTIGVSLSSAWTREILQCRPGLRILLECFNSVGGQRDLIAAGGVVHPRKAPHGGLFAYNENLLTDRAPR